MEIRMLKIRTLKKVNTYVLRIDSNSTVNKLPTFYFNFSRFKDAATLSGETLAVHSQVPRNLIKNVLLLSLIFCDFLDNLVLFIIIIIIAIDVWFLTLL